MGKKGKGKKKEVVVEEVEDFGEFTDLNMGYLEFSVQLHELRSFNSNVFLSKRQTLKR